MECAITPNDRVKAESGAMVTMSSGVDVEAKLEGGAGAACFRSCCAGKMLGLLPPGHARCMSLPATYTHVIRDKPLRELQLRAGESLFMSHFKIKPGMVRYSDPPPTATYGRGSIGM